MMSAASDYANGRIVGRMVVLGPVRVPSPFWWLGYWSAQAEWWWRQWLPC